jgi:mercuric ion transport protein
MTNTIETSEITSQEIEESRGKTSFFAVGGIIGAIAASSCCVLPLALTLLGVSGAWMSNLRTLAPYQPYFIAATAVLIGLGFYSVYWKSRQVCAIDAACSKPLPNRLVKSGLWLGTALVLIALTFPYWFDSIEPYLP